MTVNGITITTATILATREHFAGLAENCISRATAGEYWVNDLTRYVKSQQRTAMDARAGKMDHSLTFAQYALWLQTGESVPLLV
jgi:hypothetical protein